MRKLELEKRGKKVRKFEREKNDGVKENVSVKDKKGREKVKVCVRERRERERDSVCVCV